MSTPGDSLKAACITVLGAGHLRPASGSWGSLFAVAIYAACWWLLAAVEAPRWAVEIVTLAGIAISSWLSVRWGQWAIDRWSRKDPSQFVLDEFAGQWVALLWLPPIAAAGLYAFGWVLGVQFLLFRILDIIKPPPARQFERLPAGTGILADDLMSGLYAAIIGQILWRLTPLASALGLASTT